MSRFNVCILFVAVALAGCTPAGPSSDADSTLLCRTCGGDGDPPPLASCWRDADHDGYGAGPVVKLTSCSAGYVTNHNDCDDTNPNITLGNKCYRDADGDGFGNAGSFTWSCGACPAGYVADATDCNDGSAATHPQTCALDLDGDGYSAPSTTCVSSCPGPAFWGDGDCNDNDATVHPEKFEVIENGKDDNCNQLVDESEFNYSDATFAGTNSLTLDFALESVQTASLARQHQPLWVQVKYVPLSNTGDEHLAFGPVTVSLPAAPASPRGRYILTGLAPETAYKLEILLFSDAAQAHPLAAGGGWWGGEPTSSPVYFAMTKSVSTDPIAQARPAMFLRAFIELENARTGVVKGGTPYCPGYNCDQQHGGDEWCSEFYDWVIEIAYREIETYGHHMYDGDIIYAYEQAGMWTDGNPALFSLHMGDYLGIGPVGGVHHSAMFVAYDQAQGKSWAINGNVGNRVALTTYDATQIGGFGVLTSSMLK